GRVDWDLNDTTGGPNKDGVYLRGIAGAGSANQTLVITGASFTTNQWRGYGIINLDQPYSSGRTSYPNTFASIYSNTPDRVMVGKAPHPSATQVWTPGNRFEIRRVIMAMDNIGNGPGDYLGGGFNPSPRWLNQTREPYYLWGNTLDGVLIEG